MSRAEQFTAGTRTLEVPLRLLATSDLHMALLPYDYHADAPLCRPETAPGLTGVAEALARLRGPPGSGEEAARSLLFDCGDSLQGGPMADFLALEDGLAPGQRHPMIAAMNLLGYAGATLGNHDFGYGLGFLDRVLADAAFPVVLSNVHRRGAGGQPGPTVRQPRALVTVPMGAGLPPLRVGLLGLAPPQLVAWEEAHLGDALSSRGMAEAAAAEVPALRAAGADLVVALVHGGLARPDAPDAAENGALAVARIPGIDILLLGHAHEVFPAPRFVGWPGVDATAGRLHGRPAVMPGMFGSHVGVIDLRLRHGPQGWQHRCTDVRAVPVAPSDAGPTRPAGPAAARTRRAAACPARRLGRLVAPAHQATRAHVARPVGRTGVRLHSHFAQIADSAALRLVAAAQRDWAAGALGRAQAAADGAAAGAPGPPILAAVAPLRAGGRAGPLAYTDVPPGPLLMRHVHDLYAFANGLRVLRVTAAGIADWLERTAALYARLAPDRPDTPLLLPEAPAYAFDVIAGLEYTLDLGAPARFAADGRRLAVAGSAGRVRGLALHGRPLAPETPCLLVTSAYRAGGGGGFPGTGADPAGAGRADKGRPGKGISGTAIPDTGPLALRGDARAALLAHIRAADAVGTPPEPPAWRLTAPAGSTALFHTAPAAQAHLHEIAALRPEPLGLTPQGFLRLRLHF